MEVKKEKLILAATILFCFFFSFQKINAQTWVEPTCDPTADPSTCDMAPPLNTSDDDQIKTGSLTIGTGSAINVETLQALTSSADLSIQTDGTIYLGTSSATNTVRGKLNVQNGSLILPQGTSTPVVGIEGKIYWNSSTDKMFVYTGSAWKEIYSDDQWVNTTGDNMTGKLDINAATTGLKVTSSASPAVEIQAGAVGLYSNGGTSSIVACASGKNCAHLGTTSWSGYFTNSTLTDYDSVGNKFLPKKAQQSLYPYIIEPIRRDATIQFLRPGPYYNVHNAVFDGTYVWAKAVNQSTSTLALLKIRPSDLQVLYADPLASSAPSEYGPIVSTNQYIAMVNQSTCKVYLTDKDTGLLKYTYSPAVAVGQCNDMIYADSISGTDNIFWMTDNIQNRLHYFNEKMTVSGSIDTTTIVSGGCQDPNGLAYDGTYIWMACQSNSTKRIIKINKNCRVGSCTAEWYYTGVKNHNLLYDNTYLWVGNIGPSATINLGKLNPNDCVGAPTNTCTFTQEFEVPNTISDMQFDGTNIWAVNESVKKIYIIPAYGSTVYQRDASCSGGSGRCYLTFDGTNMWESWINLSTGVKSGINVWSTSNGNYGVSGPNHFSGIIVTDSAGTAFCAFASTTAGVTSWNFSPVGTVNFDTYCNNGT
ncbi:MAG: hypothetical protein WC752_04020 [Patescibacteria group bacterium]